jgi:predicted RNA-binding Zn-ribbon protein involved in translation (DUF1610 family)
MFGPIKLSDAIRFFEAKGVSRTCPSCGHETCDLIDEARADVHFALPGFKFDGYDSGQADMMLGLFVLACEECGFVRLYHRSVIAAWIERNPYSGAERHVAPSTQQHSDRPQIV